MKNLIFGVVVIIIIIAAGAWLLNRAEVDEDLDEVQHSEEISDIEAEKSGQFLQVVPTEVGSPPGDESETDGGADADSNEAGTDITNGEVVTISVDENGFTPTEVNVKTGTTVTFVNNGQALHWPASDVHPTHEVLPEFDSKQGLQTGQSYSYTFTEAGEWNFHDHLFPNFVGTITVTE